MLEASWGARWGRQQSRTFAGQGSPPFSCAYTAMVTFMDCKARVSFVSRKSCFSTAGFEALRFHLPSGPRFYLLCLL